SHRRSRYHRHQPRPPGSLGALRWPVAQLERRVPHTGFGLAAAQFGEHLLDQQPVLRRLLGLADREPMGDGWTVVPIGFVRGVERGLLCCTSSGLTGSAWWSG